jgi:midasin
VIDTCLIGVQNLLKRCEGDIPLTDEEEKDNYLKDELRTIHGLTTSLQLTNVIKRVETLLLACAERRCQRNELLKILPFFQVYVDIAQSQFRMHAHSSYALFKLTYVLCSIMTTLSTEGFCKPPESSEEENGDGEGGELSSGVGMGEGSGAQNVSKEIDEEYQVEGLQGENEERQQENKPDDDGDAVEMSEDFGGDMQDVPDQAGDEDGDSEKDEDNDDLDEHVDDLGDSEQKVDEKFWGDKTDKADDQNEDTADQNGSNDQQQNTDVVAKEKEGSNLDKKPSSDDSKEINDDDIDDPVPEADEERPGEAGAPMDDTVPDAENLDLPDDLDLGTNEPDSRPDDDDMELDDDDDVEGGDTSNGVDMDSTSVVEDDTNLGADVQENSPEDTMNTIPVTEEIEDKPDHDKDNPKQSAIGQPDLSNADAGTTGGQARGQMDVDGVQTTRQTTDEEALSQQPLNTERCVGFPRKSRF